MPAGPILSRPIPSSGEAMPVVRLGTWPVFDSLGATDRAIRLVDRFAGCFSDSRTRELIGHEVPTLVGQRMFGIALGYEDVMDRDEVCG